MDTMKTAPSKQQPIQDQDKGVRVKLLRFCVGHNSKPDIPLKWYPVNGGIGSLGSSERIEITWLRQLRHFRIVEKSHVRGEREHITMIHETWATWEPMPD